MCVCTLCICIHRNTCIHSTVSSSPGPFPPWLWRQERLWSQTRSLGRAPPSSEARETLQLKASQAIQFVSVDSATNGSMEPIPFTGDASLKTCPVINRVHAVCARRHTETNMVGDHVVMFVSVYASPWAFPP